MENISINDMKMSENKTKIDHFNDDCIQQIIKKLTIEEILIEAIDKRS
jgi:hypothetical protein